MPPRADPPDRLAVEAALPPEQLAALEQACELGAVSREGWHLIPSWAAHYSTLAAVALSDRLRIEEGETAEAALVTACIRLAVEVETVRSRLHRWPRQAAEASVHSAPSTRADAA